MKHSVEEITLKNGAKGAEVVEIPKADFALTTAVTAMANSLGLGPVVTGIIICVYGLYNVVDLARKMMKTYNFDA